MLCKIIQSDAKFLASSSIIMGIMAFVCIHGTWILDFQYDAWLLTGGDLTQHYLGWTFFRNSAWHFPIGLMDGIIYPDLVSIIYTDSIPLLAILFKLFDRLLPTTFQYFGLWGLLCYALQSLLSAFILRYFIKNNFVCLIGSVFFTLSATMMLRLYTHTALAGHWIILLAIVLLLYRKRLTCRFRVIMWSIMPILCVGVHAYFVPMTFIFLVIGSIVDYLEDKHLKRFFYYNFSYIASLVLALYLLGAFSIGRVPSAGGLGIYNSNLNTFFSPCGWSKFLPSLPGISAMQQGEGFGYLGAGILVLVIISSLIIVFYGKQLASFAKIEKFNIIIIISITAIFILLACLPNLSYGSNILYSIIYPEYIDKFLSIYRANGRFIWVPMYCIMFSCIIICSKGIKNNMGIMILAIAVIIQIVDLSGIMQMRFEKYTQIQENSFRPSKIDFLNECHFKHITFLPNTEDDASIKLYDIASYAQRNKLSISDFHIARKSKDKLNERIKSKIRSIEDNSICADEVFVINNPTFFLGDKTALNFYMVEGIIFASYEEKEVLASYRYDEPDKVNILDLGMHVSNGSENNKQFTILPGGVLFGPYTALRKGAYVVEIIGSNLAKLEYDVSYDSGKHVLPIKELVHTNEKITYEILADDILQDVEFRVINNSVVNGKVMMMWIKRTDAHKQGGA